MRYNNASWEELADLCDQLARVLDTIAGSIEPGIIDDVAIDEVLTVWEKTRNE